jgi:hypothetical protein
MEVNDVVAPFGHRSEIMVLILLLTLTACAPAAPSPHFPVLVPTVRIETPLIAPTSTAETVTPGARLATTSSPTQTVASNSSQTPLPQILLNLGSSTSPLYACVDKPGQVWATQAPYTSTYVLLASDTTSYYYPTWSPDHQWIAYIVVDPRSPQLKPSSGVANRREFSQSDSIWIMRPDGSQRHRLSETFPRVELDTTNGCYVGSGITSFVGWSSDSRWLGFVYLSSDEGQTTTLYAISLETGKTQQVASQVSAAAWSHTGDVLALVTSNYRQLAVVDAIGALRTEIPVTSALLRYRFSEIQWSYNDDAILVVGSDHQSYDAPQLLWRIDVTTNEWRKVSEWEGKYTLRVRTAGEYASVCIAESGSGRIEILNQLTLETVKTIEVPTGIDCETANWYKYDGHDQIVFGVGPHGQPVELADTLQDTSPRRLMDTTTSNLPAGMQMFYFSLQQAP